MNVSVSLNVLKPSLNMFITRNKLMLLMALDTLFMLAIARLLQNRP